MSWLRLKLGRAGERAACKYLRRCGYKVLDRNYTCPSGEIDIICYQDDTIVFVEVKTRSDDASGDPEDNITPSKQRRITRVAREWLNARRKPECKYRFDAVSVVLPPDGEPKIRHIQEAFLPMPSRLNGL